MRKHLKFGSAFGEQEVIPCCLDKDTPDLNSRCSRVVLGYRDLYFEVKSYFKRHFKVVFIAILPSTIPVHFAFPSPIVLQVYVYSIEGYCNAYTNETSLKRKRYRM